MSIRPVHMQMEVSRSQEISKLAQERNQKGTTDQQQFMSHMDKEIRHQSESVVKKSESDLYEKRFDAKEKGSNQYEDKRKKKKKQHTKESKNKNTNTRPGGFDIKI
ncbi:MAG: hypothetical protein U0L23_10540 [Lachnospiraceae bacterium]|nr:hypothetical protein [Lachnospiraceae bacterium]